MTKEEIKNREKKLIELTEIFCTHKLNNEYSSLCKSLVKKLGRKREVPFKRGNIEIWAAAVVYAIGSINFLFDKSAELYITTEQLNEYFQTKNSTVSNKARQIKDMFNLWHYNPEFSTQRMIENNPFNNMVMVDGFIVPLDSIPKEFQEQVKQARAEGGDIEFTTED